MHHRMTRRPSDFVHNLTQLPSYFLCEKSDGIRCLLYFAKGEVDPRTGVAVEAHWLIDRKNNYYYVPGLHFPYPGATPDEEPIWASFHIDTLLDGELLWDIYDVDAIGPDGRPLLDATGKPTKAKHRSLKFLVFDCLVLDGANLCPKLLDKRLAHFYEGVLKPYKALCKKFPDDTREFPFIMEQKSTQRSYGIEMMFREVIPNLKHTTDGLIFTCKETPYQSGTDENIVKWKPAHENSVDFKLDLEFPPLPAEQHAHQGQGQSTNGDTQTPELDYDAIPTARLHIYGGETQPDIPYSTLSLPSADWELMKKWSVDNNSGLDGQIIECHKDKEGHWRYMKFRTDKAEANHISTADKVMQSIDDAVTEQDLYAAAQSIRTGWKEREAVAIARAREAAAARAREQERVETERRRRVRAQEMQQLQQQQTIQEPDTGGPNAAL